jgi:hypothetical protein
VGFSVPVGRIARAVRIPEAPTGLRCPPKCCRWRRLRVRSGRREILTPPGRPPSPWRGLVPDKRSLRGFRRTGSAGQSVGVRRLPAYVMHLRTTPRTSAGRGRGRPPSDAALAPALAAIHGFYLHAADVGLVSQPWGRWSASRTAGRPCSNHRAVGPHGHARLRHAADLAGRTVPPCKGDSCGALHHGATPPATPRPDVPGRGF